MSKSLHFLFLWLSIFSLIQNSQAETFNILQKAPLENQANKKLVSFIEDFNKAKVFRELIPLAEKTFADEEIEKEKEFFKKILRSHMTVEAPELIIQGDLIQLNFEKNKYSITARFNKHNNSLYIKNKKIDLNKHNVESLFKELSSMKLISQGFNPLNAFISEAHAIPLVIFAVAGVLSMAVTAVGLFSNWSRSGCFGRYEDVYRSFETALVDCTNDTQIVMENPSSKKNTDTYNYINEVKEISSKKSKSKNCKKEVSEHFKYFSFFRKKVCIPAKRVQTMCEKMKEVESCLSAYMKLDSDRVIQHNQRTSPSNQNTGAGYQQNNQNGSNTGEQ